MVPQRAQSPPPPPPLQQYMQPPPGAPPRLAARPPPVPPPPLAGPLPPPLLSATPAQAIQQPPMGLPPPVAAAQVVPLNVAPVPAATVLWRTGDPSARTCNAEHPSVHRKLGLEKSRASELGRAVGCSATAAPTDDWTWSCCYGCGYRWSSGAVCTAAPTSATAYLRAVGAATAAPGSGTQLPPLPMPWPQPLLPPASTFLSTAAPVAQLAPPLTSPVADPLALQDDVLLAAIASRRPALAAMLGFAQAQSRLRS